MTGLVDSKGPFDGATGAEQERKYLKILVVDDDQFQRILAGGLLSKIQANIGNIEFNVVEAQNAAMGIAAFMNDDSIGVIITDLDMPDLNDGLDMIRTIRSYVMAPQPFIIVRSNRSSDEKRSILGVGANGMITKTDPNELADLELLLRAAFLKMRSGQDLNPEPKEP